MARYTGAVCRLCRREGQKLFLKGERCYSDKCGIGRECCICTRTAWSGRKKMSNYRIQLRENKSAPVLRHGKTMSEIF